MKNETSFYKFAGITAILSCLIALTSILLIFSAFNWDFETAFTPAKAIAFQPDPSNLLRWGWILDIFGYYLPLVPLVLALHHHLAEKSPLRSQMFAFFGLGYMTVGALGAAMLAGATAPLFEAFQAGDATQKAAATLVFSNLNNEILNGVWNIFSMLMAAIWWLGIGWLMCSQHKWLARFTLILGVFCLLDVFGNIFQVEILSSIGLNFYLLAAPIWAAWVGGIFFQNRKQ